jgi:hypothetical protein
MVLQPVSRLLRETPISEPIKSIGLGVVTFKIEYKYLEKLRQKK